MNNLTEITTYEIIYTQDNKEYTTTDNIEDLSTAIKKALNYRSNKTMSNVRIMASIHTQQIFNLDEMI